MLRGATPLTFTRPRSEEPTKLVTFNAPKSLHEYLKQAGAELPRGYTDIIIRAIEFDRDLGDMTKPFAARLEAFAASKGLSLQDDAAKVVALLLEAGLSAVEAEQGKKKR